MQTIQLAIIATVLIFGIGAVAYVLTASHAQPNAPAAAGSITSSVSTMQSSTSQSTTMSTTVAASTSVSAAAPQSETWTLQDFVIGPKAGNEQDLIVAMPNIIRYSNGTYRMYYSWANPAPGSAPATAIKSATSTDGMHWTVDSGYRIWGNSSQNQSQYVVAGPSIVMLANGSYRMYYDAEPQGKPGTPPQFEVYSAVSKDGVGFKAEGLRIAISSQTGISFAGHSKFFALPNGTTVGICSCNLNTSSSVPSTLVLTTSTDGLTFSHFRSLFNNAKWHDPTVFQVNGTYKMYATYLTSTKGYAASTDGITWPSTMTNITFQAKNGTVLTEGNSGVGDIGGAVLPNGTWAMYTDWQNPSQNLVYFVRTK